MSTIFSARAFGASLRQSRLTQGLSQEQASERANVHRTYWGAVERGEKNVTVAVAWRMAEAVGASLPRLLEDLPSFPAHQSDLA